MTPSETLAAALEAIFRFAALAHRMDNPGTQDENALALARELARAIMDRAREPSPFRRAYLNDPVSAGERGAANPQVASGNPQVAQSGMRGWLGRWIHRKRRTP